MLLLVLDSTATGAATKNVLLVYDEDKEFPGLAILHDSLRTRFKAELSGNVDFYTESMGLSQFRNPDYDRALRDHYQRKYAGKPIDLIVAAIIEAHGGRIWATANEDHGLTVHVELPM